MLLELGDRPFDVTHRAIVIGSLTRRRPDHLGSMLARAQDLIDAGADAIEVAVAADRDGHPADEADDMERLVPAVAELRRRFDLPVVASTAHAGVVSAAAAAGADALAGGVGDLDWLAESARSGVAVILDAAPAQPRVDGEPPRDIVAEVHADLARQVTAARSSGVEPSRLIVDSGLAASAEEAASQALLRGTEALVAAGHVVAQSSAWWDGYGIRATSTDRPDSGAAALHAVRSFGIILGVRVLRAVDVRAARRVAAVMAAILEARP